MPLAGEETSTKYVPRAIHQAVFLKIRQVHAIDVSEDRSCVIDNVLKVARSFA